MPTSPPGLTTRGPIEPAWGYLLLRRGRPASGQVRDENLTIPIRSDLRAALQRQADLQGRSVSAEVERLLAEAVGSDMLARVLDVGRGRQRAGLLLLLDLVIGEVAVRANFGTKPAPALLDDPWRRR